MHIKKRRRLQSISTAFLMLLSTAAFTLTTPAIAAENSANPTVNEQLAQCIADAVKEAQGEDQVTSLNCRSFGKINDLSQLTKLTNLTELNLSMAEIVSLTGIEKLSNLQQISLHVTKLKSLDGIEKLTKLTKVDVEKNDISDISPLAKITSLKTAILSKNQIWDLSPLKDSKVKITAKLQRPILTRYVGDPAPVVKNEKGEILKANKQSPNFAETFTTEGKYTAQYGTAAGFLVNLEVNVLSAAERPQTPPASDTATSSPSTPEEGTGDSANTGNTQPFPAPPAGKVDQDQSPIKDSQLRACIRRVPGNRIGGAGEVTLAHVQALTKLECVGTNITSLEGLQHATNLKELNLTQTKISSVQPLNKLPNLEILRLDQTKVKDFSSLTSLPKLKELYLFRAGLTSISDFGDFPNLTHLSLLQNDIQDISRVSAYTNLEFLNASQNQINSFAPIAKLTKLKDLQLHHNKITAIDGIDALTKLTKLSLGTNKIKDITPIGKLTQLLDLSVRDNQINDVSALKSLVKATRIDISENPVTNANTLAGMPIINNNPKPNLKPIDLDPAKVPAPEAPKDAILHWYGMPGAATGAAIAPKSCDFTGDGKDDIIIGAWAHQEKETGMVGLAYVLPNGAAPGDLDNPDTGAIKIYGPRAGSLTGFNVSCVGDINQDGKEDIGISSHNADRGYIVFGTDSRAPIKLSDLGEKGIVLAANATKVGAGWMVTSAGDLDGDSVPDVAVVTQASPKNKRGGEIVVLSGAATKGMITLEDSPHTLVRIVGTPDMPVFNFTQAGDVDGDGVNDLLVGGYYGTAFGAKAEKTGMAWVISGKSRGLVNVAGVFDGFIINGPLRGGDRLGIAATPLGDINNDGYADIAVAANPTKANGAIAVVLGAPRHDTIMIDPDQEYPISDAQGTRGWWIYDSRPSHYLGYGLSAVPARNGMSGTIVIGISESSRAIAFDTSILTGSVDTKPAATGKVDLALIDPKFKVELNGAHRLGRSVGIVRGFNEHKGMLMVVGADNATNPTGRGSVILAAMPALHRLSEATAPDQEKEKEVAQPNHKKLNAASEKPAAALKPSISKAEAGIVKPEIGKLAPAPIAPKDGLNASSLASTGSNSAIALYISLMLVLAGGFIFRRMQKQN